MITLYLYIYIGYEVTEVWSQQSVGVYQQGNNPSSPSNPNNPNNPDNNPMITLIITVVLI